MDAHAPDPDAGDRDADIARMYFEERCSVAELAEFFGLRHALVRSIVTTQIHANTAAQERLHLRAPHQQRTATA